MTAPSKKPKLSLDEYLKAKARGACWVCSHPWRKEIEDGFKSGRGGTLITKWLRAEGYAEATRHKLEVHYANHIVD